MFRKMSSFERSTLRWSRAAVLLSLLAAAFVCLQWYEMHEGGKDTHDLALEAKTQAERTKVLSNEMKKQADYTSDLAYQMKQEADHTKDVADRTKEIAAQALVQAQAASVAATAARDSAETERRALELSERPWLLVKAELASALTYDKEGAKITVHYTITNIGHSPAVGVSVVPEFYIQDRSKPHPIVERRRFCDQAKSMSSMGHVVYPGEIFEINESFMATTSDIRKSAEAFYNEFFAAGIIDCVVYKAGFESKTFAVGTSYDLLRILPNGIHASFPAFQDMPLGSIYLIPSSFFPRDDE